MAFQRFHYAVCLGQIDVRAINEVPCKNVMSGLGCRSKRDTQRPTYFKNIIRYGTIGNAIGFVLQLCAGLLNGLQVMLNEGGEGDMISKLWYNCEK